MPIIEQPSLPRQRRAPARLEIGQQGTHHYPATAKDNFKQIYFGAIDVATESITSRFNQKDFKTYENILELLLKSVSSDPYDQELSAVVAMYADSDVDLYKLVAQLSLMPQVAQSMEYDINKLDICDLVDLFRNFGEEQKLSRICTLGKILLVMPATNAQVSGLFLR